MLRILLDLGVPVKSLGTCIGRLCRSEYAWKMWVSSVSHKKLVQLQEVKNRGAHWLIAPIINQNEDRGWVHKLSEPQGKPKMHVYGKFGWRLNVLGLCYL